MPTTLSRVFTSTIQQQHPRSTVSPAMPMLNVVSDTLNNFFASDSQVIKKKALMRWFKGIPELTALATKVAKDTVYRYHFEPVNQGESGRNKVMAANKFSIEVGLRKAMLSQMIDNLVTGEAYGWIGKIDKKDAKEAIRKVVSRSMFIETKEMEDKLTEELSNVAEIDEDIRKPRKYRAIASSTMEIIHNKFDVVNYKQRVGMNTIFFNTNEIIRYNLEEFDGKISGFSPVESILVQLELLRFMWQNMMSIHKNGGAPDKMFILENITAGSDAYKRIEQQIKKYKLVENKHGNMLFTGKVSIEDLQQMDQMQFKDMGLYITGLIAMQWQVPKSSIPYILGDSNTKEDTGGNSEKGYWRNVENMQMIFSETMNSQLWIPYFGVKIVFDSTFVQQDVQIQTARNLLLTNLQTTTALLRNNKKKLKDQKMLKLLGLDMMDVEDMTDEDLFGEMGQPGMANQLSNSQANDSDDKKNVNARKRDEQTSMMGRGMASTSGVGKEIKRIKSLPPHKPTYEVKQIKKYDAATIRELKDHIGVDGEVVEFNQFIKFYIDDKAFQQGRPPRVFMKQNDSFTTLKYKSTDFVYKTFIANEDLVDRQVQLSNLEGNIFRM